jgi:hypothetical protein
MGFLFGSGTPQPKKPPDYTRLQVQTSVNYLPIPLIYGCPRVSPNLLWADDFRVVHVKTSSGGGKGLLTGGKGSSTTTSYYYASLILGIGEGPIGPPIMIWINTSQYVYGQQPTGLIGAAGPPLRNIITPLKGGGGGTPPPPPGTTFPGTWYGGTPDQAPDPVIAGRHPGESLAYADTGYFSLIDAELDSSASVPQYSFVIGGHWRGSCPLNNDFYAGFADADPTLCIIDLLTNLQFGVPGFPRTLIDPSIFTSTGTTTQGDNSYQTWCQAVGIGFSTVLNGTEAARSILERWLLVTSAAAVWTGSTLKIIPYGDSGWSGNPGWEAGAGIPFKYYQPNVKPLFDLTDDDFLQASGSEDPVTVTRKDLADVYNTVRIDYQDRANQWNTNTAEARDDNAVELFGMRVQSVSANELTWRGYADAAATLIMRRNVQVRNTYTFKLPWDYAILEPMDIVTITDAVLGLDKAAVRITAIEEDENAHLTITAEQFTPGWIVPSLYPGQSSKQYTVDTSGIAGSVNQPAIFEPTAALVVAKGGSGAYVAIGASGGPSGVYDPNWGGADVYLSVDNVTYVKQGTITGPARQGILQALLPTYTGGNPDTSSVLSVNLAECDGELETVTAADAAAARSLCVVIDQNQEGFELLSYQTATLTAANAYNLTTLYRGLYGTKPCQHAVGALFLRLDQSVWEISLQPQYVGQQLYFKLQSFNVFNQGYEDLSSCTAYSYTPTGAGINPASNSIWQALTANTPTDFGLIGQPVLGALDLDLGGGVGNCEPTLGLVDLGTV